jgi:uncharacterized integral membrane protein
VRILYWIVTGLIALVLVIFAVANRDLAVVTFWPLPYEWPLPLCVIVLLGLLIGFLFGQLVAWINGGRWRREARRRQRRIEDLERELAATRARLPAEPYSGALPPSQRVPARAAPRD